MNAKKSPFVLKNFLLLRQNIEFLPPPEEKAPGYFLELMNAYDIDIDFVVKDIDNKFIQIFVKIEVNNSKTKEYGYSIQSEGVGIFEFDKSVALSDIDKPNLIYFSGLSICINSLRAIITNVTSFAPIGRYSLPSIDVNSLLVDKGVIKENPNPVKKTKNTTKK